MNQRFPYVTTFGLAVLASAGCGFGDNHATADDGVLPPDAAISIDANVTPPPDSPGGGSDAPPMPTACVLVPQSGCSGTQACDLAASTGTSTTCRPVATAGTSNDRCATQNDCAAGYSCAATDDAPTIKWCHRMCDANADCGSNERCVFTLEDTNGDPTVDVCSNSCNPVTSGGCPTGTGCMTIEAGATDYTDCIVMGTTPDGGACGGDADCFPGSACLTVGTVTSCHSYCEVGGTDCGVGQTCAVINPPVSIAGKAIGACR